MALRHYFCGMKKWLAVFAASAFITSCGGDEQSAPPVSTEQQQWLDRLSDAVKQNPDSAGLRMRLINSLDSLNMFKEAIAQTDSLIKKDSVNNGLWFTKAQLQESNKDTAGAIQSYRRALAVYPSIETQLNYANLLAETKNREALAVCQNVQKMGLGRETDASCYFIAGVYFARTGNNKQALELFDKAINDNYTLIEAYMEKGFIYYESKDYQQALKTFETANTVNKTYADAYYWKAKCQEAIGDKTEALVNYKRSLGLDKTLKEAAEAIKRLD
jgi:tetratricopeptide (TPR) repeat protein